MNVRSYSTRYVPHSVTVLDGKPHTFRCVEARRRGVIPYPSEGGYMDRVCEEVFIVPIGRDEKCLDENGGALTFQEQHK